MSAQRREHDATWMPCGKSVVGTVQSTKDACCQRPAERGDVMFTHPAYLLRVRKDMVQAIPRRTPRFERRSRGPLRFFVRRESLVSPAGGGRHDGRTPSGGHNGPIGSATRLPLSALSGDVPAPSPRPTGKRAVIFLGSRRKYDVLAFVCGSQSGGYDRSETIHAARSSLNVISSERAVKKTCMIFGHVKSCSDGFKRIQRAVQTYGTSGCFKPSLVKKEKPRNNTAFLQKIKEWWAVRDLAHIMGQVGNFNRQPINFPKSSNDFKLSIAKPSKNICTIRK